MDVESVIPLFVILSEVKFAFDCLKQKQRGLGGYYVAGPPLLNGRCTSLLRAPRLRG